MTAPAAPGDAATGVVALARAGRFDTIVERLAPPLRALATPDALRAAWEAALGEHGPVVSVGEPVEEPARAGVVMVRVPVSCERGGVTVVVAVAEGGVLGGVQLAPLDAAPVATWSPPGYVDPSAFGEREVVLGDGPLSVGGTLSLPVAPGRHAGVVLLAGSGPLDRDETIGPNKPLKDLAWGLASRGIAVLRFDKASFTHPDDVRRIVGFTLADEYGPAASAAIDVLRKEPGVDPDRIFVAGHSLGGTAAPRVAAAERAVAGLVILAGGAAPLHRSIVRQVRYLASLDEASAASIGPAVPALERRADLVDSDRLSVATPDAELPLGVPASYWLDLRGYDPVASARALDRPVLLVQGGRDYQATVEDDLARWRAGLAGRSDVTVRVHPSLNHGFAPGSGPATPAEYQEPQHVAPEVVAEIAQWLLSAAGPGPGVR